MILHGNVFDSAFGMERNTLVELQLFITLERKGDEQSPNRHA